MKRRKKKSCGLGITIAQAQELRYGQVLYHSCERNADGTPLRVRVTGRPKIWASRPDHIEVPVRYGLKFNTRLTMAELASTYVLDEDAAFCCDGNPGALVWPQGTVGPKDRAVLREVQLLQSRVSRAAGKGKECIEARLVELDRYMEKNGITHTHRGRRTK